MMKFNEAELQRREEEAKKAEGRISIYDAVRMHPKMYEHDKRVFRPAPGSVREYKPFEDSPLLVIVEYSHFGDSSDMKDAHHYRVTLRNGKHEMTAPFSTGSAWKRRPDCFDVLCNLVMDTQDYLASPFFTEWAEEYGYDTDSIKAKAIFDAVAEQTRQFMRVMGGMASVEGLEEMRDLFEEHGVD